jgi:hypothetical protein
MAPTGYPSTTNALDPYTCLLAVHRCDYWIRHVQPDYTIEFAESIDAGVKQLFLMCEGVDVNSWSKHAQEQICLRIQLQGCGLQTAEDRQYVHFMGGTIQSVLPLINRKDREGNTISGCLHIPAVVNMLGEDSFHHPSTSPWEFLLSAARPTSNLKSGLQYTWLHLTQNFKDVATALETLDKKLLLSQSVEHAGFYADGTHAPLVIDALTLEMETQQSRCLGERITAILNCGKYERWAWEAWTKMSATFLHFPPDQLGYMEDEVFQAGIATYLGQPYPLMALVMGCYFGKRGKQLNRYDAILLQPHCLDTEIVAYITNFNQSPRL